MATWSIANLFKPTKPIESFTKEEVSKINKTAIGVGIIGGIAGFVASIPVVGTAIISAGTKAISAISSYALKKPVQTAGIVFGGTIYAKSQGLQDMSAQIPKLLDKATDLGAKAGDELASLPSESKDVFGLVFQALQGREMTFNEKQKVIDLLAKYGVIASIAMTTEALFKLYKNTIGTQYYFQTNTDKEKTAEVKQDKTTNPNIPTPVTPVSPTTPTVVNVYYDNPITQTPIASTTIKKTPVKKATTKKKAKKKVVKKKAKKKVVKKKAKKKVVKKKAKK